MFKIALVDDSVILRSAIRNVLESSGFEVVFEAGGSAELFSKINGSGVGLVLLDIFFPTENGLDILAKLKKHLPADGILFKPFDTDELLSSIHRLLPKQGK